MVVGLMITLEMRFKFMLRLSQEYATNLCLYAAQWCAVASLAESMAVPLMWNTIGLGRDLEYIQGAVDSSPPLHEGHCGIFNVH